MMEKVLRVMRPQLDFRMCLAGWGVIKKKKKKKNDNCRLEIIECEYIKTF